MLLLGVVGSRQRISIDDYQIVESIIKQFLEIHGRKLILVSGGCSKGADNFAEIAAKKLGIPILIYYPDKQKLESLNSDNHRRDYAIVAYERNTEARSKCIESYGYNCQICGFNFESKYGDIGRNYIHVHHIIPLSEINKEYELDVDRDLIPICPNCHTMLHRREFSINIEELKKRIK